MLISVFLHMNNISGLIFGHHSPLGVIRQEPEPFCSSQLLIDNLIACDSCWSIQRYIEDITRWRKEINFIFEWQKNDFTNERSE